MTETKVASNAGANYGSSKKRKYFADFHILNAYDIMLSTFDKEFSAQVNTWYKNTFKGVTKCKTKNGCYTVMMESARKDKYMGQQWPTIIMQYMFDNEWEFIRDGQMSAYTMTLGESYTLWFNKVYK
mmetsp:Transcript_99980/g.122319  ORF Transcript_99980/g.122319 Transcript_99980/m.122319 type:complete len:127 (-) Transcript_99980:45-425(-)